MTAPRAATLICLLGLAPSLATGQSSDAAAERARLGNERIQAEAERRVREERELQNRAANVASELAGAPPQHAGSPAMDGRVEPRPPEAPSPASASVRPAPAAAPATGSSVPDPAADEERTTRALRQLRELGELKDAGYVTDEEFRRIKERILERQL